MNVEKLLKKAGVPAELLPEAIACLRKADHDSNGLMWAKWRVRLFKAGQIAKQLSWERERLIDVRPDLADWDIAPMLNITAHGDNLPWNPATGRPEPGQWLDANPESMEYQAAVKDCYWSRGNHPRSKKARKDWYRRNAGEYRAWRLGIPVSAAMPVEQWSAGGVTVLHCGTAWQLKSFKKLVAGFGLKTRIGYEIDNVFKNGVQQWYPIPDHDLRAPLTWSVLPGFRKKGDA